MLYHFSRAMYRALADGIVAPPASAPGGAAVYHVRVLRACEGTLARMGTDRYYFANPSRALIRELRPYFPLDEQRRMRDVVERYLARADEELTRQFATGYDLAGNRLNCRALTRKGTPCQRFPNPVNGYCPSHQHLAGSGHVATEAEAAAERELVAA
ncbi:hypothetical protein Cwoe_0831 [Conexibacter woesei DSM 14684]|uniref:Uncharacterized protein n=2 Tax=Conexibacter TaxID=191494 RepID=D3FAJ5_CONWI|nr:hypothetical protein Cwoe_0831 [Conexibacter woesei DSM 14684]